MSCGNVKQVAFTSPTPRVATVSSFNEVVFGEVQRRHVVVEAKSARVIVPDLTGS